MAEELKRVHPKYAQLFFDQAHTAVKDAAIQAKGNAAFASRDFDTAIKHFTDAIEIDSDNHVLYSNRSACQASLENWEPALQDAQRTVELKPEWPKGYSRLGGAYYGLGNYQAAVDAYKKGLQFDSSNELLKNGLRDAEQALAGGGPSPLGGLFGTDFIAKLAMNPETRAYLNQPDFMTMLKTAGSNPQMLMAYAKDPRFSKALEVGLGLSLGMPPDVSGSAGSEEGKSTSRAAQPASKSAPAKQPEPQPEPESDLSEEERTEREKKAKALEEKAAGNAAYKKKDFEAAIKHYNAALELYDKDISFITNRAAVHFEQKNYEEAIKDCELAVERGRELRADFKMLAKAMTRQGNCYVQLGRLEDAVSILNKALTEHRNPDTLNLLRKTEKQLEEAKEGAYINVDLAVEAKDAGNKAFQDADYPLAVQHYTEALKRGPPKVWPEVYKVYSNRAACYTKLGALPEGEKDADMCISLAPDFAKGWSRKANILFMMKDYDKALETYEKGLEHAPDNQELKDGVVRVQYQLQRFMSGMASEEEMKERQARAMQDPGIQNIMSDPVMQQVLKECSENPSAIKHHFQDPMMGSKLRKLMTAGIIRMA